MFHILDFCSQQREILCQIRAKLLSFIFALMNGKFGTLQDGETSVFHGETKTFVLECKTKSETPKWLRRKSEAPGCLELLGK